MQSNFIPSSHFASARYPQQQLHGSMHPTQTQLSPPTHSSYHGAMSSAYAVDASSNVSRSRDFVRVNATPDVVAAFASLETNGHLHGFNTPILRLAPTAGGQGAYNPHQYMNGAIGQLATGAGPSAPWLLSQPHVGASQRYPAPTAITHPASSSHSPSSSTSSSSSSFIPPVIRAHPTRQALVDVDPRARAHPYARIPSAPSDGSASWTMADTAPIAKYRRCDLRSGRMMGEWPTSHDSQLGGTQGHTAASQRQIRGEPYTIVYRDGIGEKHMDNIHELCNPGERIACFNIGFGEGGESSQISISSSFRAVEHPQNEIRNAHNNNGQSWASSYPEWDPYPSPPSDSSSPAYPSSQSNASECISPPSSATSAGDDSPQPDPYSTSHVQHTCPTHSLPPVPATVTTKTTSKRKAKAQDALKPIKPRKRYPRGVILSNCSGPLSEDALNAKEEAKERQETKSRVRREMRAAELLEKQRLREAKKISRNLGEFMMGG